MVAADNEKDQLNKSEVDSYLAEDAEDADADEPAAKKQKKNENVVDDPEEVACVA